MAARHALRLVQHRFSSSSGKVLSQEGKAAECVSVKKIDLEKLENLAFKQKVGIEKLEKFAWKQAEHEELAQRLEAVRKEIRAEVGDVKTQYQEIKAEHEELAQRLEALRQERTAEVGDVKTQYQEIKKVGIEKLEKFAWKQAEYEELTQLLEALKQHLRQK